MEADDRAGRCGFTAAGLSHQAEYLSGLHVEAHIINRVDHRPLHRKAAVLKSHPVQQILCQIKLLNQMLYLQDLTHSASPPTSG